MIKPTIGRVVHFFQPNQNPLISCKEGQPLTALIVDVLSDTMVNLVVFDLFGHSHPQPYCMLVQPEDERKPAEPYCTWMSFQVGQTPAANAVQADISDLKTRLAALESRLSGEVSPLAGPAPTSLAPVPPLPLPPI